MAMTKRDFQTVADAIEEAKRTIKYTYSNSPANATTAEYALGVATRELATACARQYNGGYGFKRQTFVEACGFPDA